MIYKLYVEVENRLHLVAEDDYLSNLQNIMIHNETDIRNKYGLGLINWVIFKNNLLLFECTRYMGVEI